MQMHAIAHILPKIKHICCSISHNILYILPKAMPISAIYPPIKYKGQYLSNSEYFAIN